MPNNVMKFLDYKVITAKFSLNEKFVFPEDGVVEISPEFNYEIEKISKDETNVYLCAEIKSALNNSMPFEIETKIVGKFYVKDWEKEENVVLIKKNAIAILFPYLRAIISTITTSANIPPYTLPIMNINALFEEQEKRKTKNK